jgi:CRISPR-associated endonuclease Cas1
MSFMYVCDYKARIYIEKGKLVVESKNNLKRMLPLEQLEGLVIFGNASVSTGCFSQLLRMGIPVTFLSHTGMFFGRLESTKHINIERQRKQFKLGEDEEFCLSFSKKIIKSKIHNQSVILRRYNRHRDIREISPIYTQIKNLKILLTLLFSYHLLHHILLILNTFSSPLILHYRIQNSYQYFETP